MPFEVTATSAMAQYFSWMAQLIIFFLYQLYNKWDTAVYQQQKIKMSLSENLGKT